MADETRKPPTDTNYVTSLKQGEAIQIGNVTIQFLEYDGTRRAKIAIMAPRDTNITKHPEKKRFIAHVVPKGPKQ